MLRPVITIAIVLFGLGSIAFGQGTPWPAGAAPGVTPGNCASFQAFNILQDAGKTCGGALVACSNGAFKFNVKGCTVTLYSTYLR